MSDGFRRALAHPQLASSPDLISRRHGFSHRVAELGRPQILAISAGKTNCRL